ncbi:MAG: sulfatase family protein [Akkermansiaceae bacterium]
MQNFIPLKLTTLALALTLGVIHSALAAETPSTTRKAADKPNFIIILTDDQGYADLGCFGGNHVKTPNIDLMAAEGAKLTDFYVAGSVCTPSRAALMTGSYPKRLGLAAGVFFAGDKNGLNPDEITIAETLKSVGYKTGIFGKWHLGDQPEFLPTRQGFDEFFGLPYSHDIHPFHTNNKKHNFPPLPLMEMEKVIEVAPDADYLTKRITERAVDFITRHKDEPFFLYIPHPIPHRPIHMSPPFMKDIPDELKEKLKDEQGIDYFTRDKIYNHSITEIDWSVGQILTSLKAHNIDQKTLVIFTSDNGPSVGKTAPLTGGKGSSYEAGQRVPTVIRWPGNIPAGQSINTLMTAMDLLPTFTKLASAEIPTDRIIDGKDILPALTTNAPSPHQAFYYFKGNSLKAIRSGKWKLHIGKPHKAGTKSNNKRGKASSSPTMALYNLEDDKAEANNLIQTHPEIAKQLTTYAKTFQTNLKQNTRTPGLVNDPKTLTERK